MQQHKYQLAVHIGHHVSDIMALPCVNKCEKTVQERRTATVLGGSPSGAAITTITHHLLLRYTLDNGCIAYEGDWLCQDYGGKWYVLSEQQYQQYFNTQQSR